MMLDGRLNSGSSSGPSGKRTFPQIAVVVGGIMGNPMGSKQLLESHMIKKILKWVGAGLLLVCVAGGSFAAHEWYAEKPFLFRAYLDRQMMKMAFENPEMLTSLGFLESVGINGHNAHLADAHPDRTDELFVKMKAFSDGLAQYDNEDLDDNQRLSKEIVMYLADMLTDAERFRYHTYPANQMGGIQSSFPSFMNSSHQIKSLEDAEHYLSRMSEVPRKYAQQLLGLKLREDRGIIPPRFVIERVLDEIQGFVDTPAQENILYTSLAEKMEEAEEIDADSATEILARAETLINETVYPAYGLFTDYFTALKTKAGDDDGYWHLPDGAEGLQGGTSNVHNHRLYGGRNSPNWSD